VPDGERARREAERELEHLHAEEPRRDVVTELVHRDDHREHREEDRQRPRVLLEELDKPAH